MKRPPILPFVAVLASVTTACLDKDEDDEGDDTAEEEDTDWETNADWYDSGDLVDADGGGWMAMDDCDDADPTVNPDAVERCDNAKDDDCDGTVDADDEDCLEPARAAAGLDWGRHGWCAPEGPLEGLRDWRRSGSPFVVGR
jgi:hypothetical protein